MSARTTIVTSPVSGRVSMVTTGTFFAESCESVGAIAAVSCGAITMPLAPWLSSVCTFEVSLEMSFSEFVVLTSVMPRAFASCGV